MAYFFLFQIGARRRGHVFAAESRGGDGGDDDDAGAVRSRRAPAAGTVSTTLPTWRGAISARRCATGSPVSSSIMLTPSRHAGADGQRAGAGARHRDGLGALMASKAGRWQDRLVSSAALVLDSLPGVWIGLMLIVPFSIELRPGC